jgi:hypothetical protein
MLRLLHRLVDYLLVLCLIYLLADVAAELRRIEAPAAVPPKSEVGALEL